MSIFNELKSFKQIRQFYYKIQMRNQIATKNNPNLMKKKSNVTYRIEEIFEKTLFCFNIKKYNYHLFQKFIIFKIENIFEGNKLVYVKSRNSNYLQGNHIFRYNSSTNNLSKKVKTLDLVIQVA